MVIVTILIIAVVIFLVAFLGFAMVRSGSYDPMSFTLLKIFVGFALIVGFSVMITS
ncbi:MAG: hypothetical protein KA773_10615 [Chloroflexi bacterium]|nr:hypothetical protein [Chloroflexota bacterium]